jgi:hypothetical protein
MIDDKMEFVLSGEPDDYGDAMDILIRLAVEATFRAHEHDERQAA